MSDQTEQAVDRARILERIRKCFALGKSSEPHEAAAAIRQAQKLIAKYAIQDDEIMGIEIHNELVITPEPVKKTMPLYLVSIAMIACRAFGCEAIFEGQRIASGAVRQCVRYFGKGNAPMLAKYAHEVMFSAMMRSWRKYQGSTYFDTAPGDRGGFWLGWVSGVEQTIIDFGMTPDEREVIKAKRDTFYETLDDKMPISQPKVSSRAMVAGQQAAKEFSIHRPMTGSSDTAQEEETSIQLNHS